MGFSVTLEDEEGKSVDLDFAEEALGLPAEHGFGYSMVNFGQRLGPNERFEVVRKLGWGRYSSVWLARDHQNCSSFVALKILTGNATELVKSGLLQELEIMQRLQSHPHDHCLPVVSHFEFPGTSEGEGLHICIVTELFATDVERIWDGYPGRLMPISLAKKVLRDVLGGLSQLHAVGCAHTDLKSANILCRHPPTTSYDAISSLLKSNPSELNPPEPSYNRMVQSAKSQPLAAKLSLDEALQCTYVLGDLGHAQILENPTVHLIAPEHYRPPEVILGGPWDQSADLWIFGCIVVEYVLGTPLFTREHPKVPPDAYHIRLMIKYLSQVFPVHRLKDYKHARKYLDLESGNFIGNPAVEPGFLPSLFQEWGAHRGLKESDITGASDLASQCLRLNPDERPTADELLDRCAWLRG